MPYIQKVLRPGVEVHGAETSGELNYLLTLEIQNYLQKKGTSYSTMNDIIGALEGCKLEFYRRVVEPYEDKKIFENGDIW